MSAKKKPPPRASELARFKKAQDKRGGPPPETPRRGTVSIVPPRPEHPKQSEQTSLLSSEYLEATSNDYMRAHQMDLTPLPVIEQMVRLAPDWTGSPGQLFAPGQHILDPCAGHGAFGLAFKRERPECARFGSEPSTLDGWQRHYQEHARCEYAELAGSLRGLAFDAIVTNPAFRIWRDIHESARDHLKPGGRLVMLGTNSWGQRSEDGLACFEKWAPSYQLRIAGTIKFRNGTNPKTGKAYTADVRSYCWWIFERELAGHRFWRTGNLPRLAAASRQWKAPPGSEAI